MKRWIPLAAGVWVGLGVIITALGQPDPNQLYELREERYQARLDERKAYIQPGELLHDIYETGVDLQLLDVRSERDFNLFHLLDSRRVTEADLMQVAQWEEKENRLIVLVGNGEAAATHAWKQLTALKVPNVYILEGGINHWLDTFDGGRLADPLPATPSPQDKEEPLRHSFSEALGGRHLESRPPKNLLGELNYEPRVELKTKARKGGGCG